MRSLLNWFRGKSPNQLKISPSIFPQGDSNKDTWIPHQLTVPENFDRTPLSHFLAAHFALPRSFLQNEVVRKHGVHVERFNQVASRYEPVRFNQGLMLKAGDRVMVTDVKLPLKEGGVSINWRGEEASNIEESVLKAELKKMVVYEDDRILVLNKPSGLAVQPGAEIKLSLDGLMHHLSREDLKLVHRLDKDASGLLILAKGAENAANLRRLFDESQIDSRVEKIYYAMVMGTPKTAFGEIVSQMYLAGSYPRERMTSKTSLRKTLLDPGKPAITQWRHLGTYIRKLESGRRIKLSMLEVRPITGRKHQLRVHLCEQLSTPIAGDAKYGYYRMRAWRMAPMPLHLHCHTIRLKRWTAEGESVTINGPLPPHFVSTMDKYPLFLPRVPKLPKPKIRSNVRASYNRFQN